MNPEKVQKRVQAMSEGDLLDWLEVAIPGMQRHLEAYRRTRNIDHLGELVIAETTANIVVTELMRKKFPDDAGEETSHAPSAPSEPSSDTGTTSARRRFLRGRRA
jgi:hypothetical protein